MPVPRAWPVTATVPWCLLSEADEWVTIECKFTADNDTATCSVVSHESDSDGNDYQIKVLRISG